MAFVQYTSVAIKQEYKERNHGWKGTDKTENLLTISIRCSSCFEAN